MDVYLFGFPDESQKTQFAYGKIVLFYTRLLEKEFDSIKPPNHQDDKFPAVFGGIVLDHFLLESDPEKNSY